MSRCANENCNNDPLNAIGAMLVSTDGDLLVVLHVKQNMKAKKIISLM